MLEKLSLSDQRIMDCLRSDYGIQVDTLVFLPLGADMNASVYRAETQSGAYFVKLKKGHHYDLAVHVHSLLHDAGIGQIIPPIKTIHGKPFQYIDEFTLIVYPFIEGESGFTHSLTDAQWVTLGKVMRKVHEFDVLPAIEDQIRREVFSPKWREAVRSLYRYMDTNPTGDEWSMKLLKFMREHRTEISRLVNRAEQLAQKIQKQMPEFVLCHSDIHGGNVLIEGKGTIYIVDWDEPIMAPKERDLMFIGGGVANVWNNPHEEEFFYQGYGKTLIDREILAYYRHERIVEDIALYGHDLLLTTAGGADRPEMYKQFVSMFDPRGVVEIAFKTDKNYLNLLEESFPAIAKNMLHYESLGFHWGGEGRLFIKKEKGEAISHVGYFESRALIEGVWYNVGALHAICTRSSHRNQGLAKELILEALEWAKNRCSFVILFTGIPNFYERLSFHSVQEYRFHLPCKHRQGNLALRQVKAPEDNELFLRCFKEREPLSFRFWMEDRGATAGFNALFATYPIFWSLHYSPAIDGFLAFRIDGKTLHLFDVVASRIPSLEHILEHIRDPIDQIYFYFSPDRFTQSATAEPHLYDKGQLMVHGSQPSRHPFMISPLSRC